MVTPSFAIALSVLLGTEPSFEGGAVYDEPSTDVEPVSEAPSDEEHGPFFEAPAVSDTAHATDPRKGKKAPVLSVHDGALCFVNGTYCKTSLVLDAGVGAGMRLPASDAGPDVPFAQFTFRGGFAVRPLMFGRRQWHPWGLGVVGSWSRGTGSVTVQGSAEDQDVSSTDSTDAVRVAALNQLWLSKKPHAMHIDFSFGAVRSDVLTSGIALWGSHAEVAFEWGGWGGVFASGDFLDRDTRVVFGFRGHGIAAGPVLAMVLAGLAMGGAM